MWPLWLTTQQTAPPVDLWASLGPFAAAVAMAIGLIIYQRQELTAERRRREQVEDERLELAERALPTLQSSTEALERSAALIGEQAAELAVARKLLERVQQRLDDGPAP